MEDKDLEILNLVQTFKEEFGTTALIHVLNIVRKSACKYSETTDATILGICDLVEELQQVW